MDCKKAVKCSTIPILLIHGGEDRFVPKEMSEEIVQSALNARLEIFPGAGHVLSFASNEKRYQKLLRDFVELCTENQE